MKLPKSYTCPHCGEVTYRQDRIRAHYCARCTQHEFGLDENTWRDRITERLRYQRFDYDHMVRHSAELKRWNRLYPLPKGEIQ
jgi:hypothetical protein